MVDKVHTLMSSFGSATVRQREAIDSVAGTRKMLLPQQYISQNEKAKAYKAAKDLLPFSIVSGHYTPGHRHSPDPKKPNPKKTGHADRFPECQLGGAYPPTPSGVRFVELDDFDEVALADARSRLQAHPSVIACWKSPGGRSRYCRHRQR